MPGQQADGSPVAAFAEVRHQLYSVRPRRWILQALQIGRDGLAHRLAAPPSPVDVVEVAGQHQDVHLVGVEAQLDQRPHGLRVADPRKHMDRAVSLPRQTGQLVDCLIGLGARGPVGIDLIERHEYVSVDVGAPGPYGQGDQWFDGPAVAGGFQQYDRIASEVAVASLQCGDEVGHALDDRPALAPVRGNRAERPVGDVANLSIFGDEFRDEVSDDGRSKSWRLGSLPVSGQHRGVGADVVVVAGFREGSLGLLEATTFGRKVYDPPYSDAQ